MIDAESPRGEHSIWAIGMLIAAVLVRSGSVPVHCWMTDLFENATFGTALLYVTPMAGAYAAVRLVLPIAPDWALRTIAIVSLVTAVYAAGMALVQREARRFFCYLFLSHSSLVLVGLEVATPIALTGGLCVWISVGMSLAGFGLTLRALEARTGRLSLTDYHGLYDHMPSLAVFFLLTGLASIGFPGTVGFIGAELLVDGAVGVYPYVGMLVVLAAALNSIAVLHAYFRLFTGSVSHGVDLPQSALVGTDRRIDADGADSGRRSDSATRCQVTLPRGHRNHRSPAGYVDPNRGGTCHCRGPPRRSRVVLRPGPHRAGSDNTTNSLVSD